MTPPRLNIILVVVTLNSAGSKARMTPSFWDGLVWAPTKCGASVPVIPIPMGLEILIDLRL